MLHLGLLNLLIGLVVQSQKLTLQLTDLGKGLDNGEWTLRALSPFKIVANIYKPRSVKTLVVLRLLGDTFVVKTFDHLYFFLSVKFLTCFVVKPVSFAGLQISGTL